MAATFYTLRLAPAEVRSRPAADRIAYYDLVVEYGLRRKDWELARGLNARGEPLPGVRPATREHRRSEMTATGKGDPRAPYLMPGRGLSRTRSLLAGKAHADYAEFWWRFDPWTGDQWGKVLAIHARRGKAYDVIGLSAKGKAWVAAMAIKAWRERMAGGPAVAHVESFAAGPIGVVGRTNLGTTVGGIGGDVEDYRALLASGKGHGLLSGEEWRRVMSAPAAPIPNIKGASASVRSGKSSVILQHIWGTTPPPKAGAGGAAVPPRPKPAPKPKPVAKKAAIPPVPAVAAPAVKAPIPPPTKPPAPKPKPAATGGPKPERVVAVPVPPPRPMTREEAVEAIERLEFPDTAAARAWAESIYGGKGTPPWERPGDGWWDSLTRLERERVRDYTGNAFREVNRSIRSGSIDKGGWSMEYVRAMRSDLDRVLAKRTTDRDVVLYRGVGNVKRFLDALGLDSVEDIRPGLEFTDGAFTSTSIAREYATELSVEHEESRPTPIRFKILVPAGTEGAWIGDNSTLPNEREFLIGRALDTFVVVGRRDGWILLRAYKSGG